MGMLIDGIFGSEAIDSSGEILNVEGADISSLEKDGVLNYEHRGDDAPGASPNDIVGKVIKAKKIFSADDCENEREKMYWEQIELPFIYGVVRLYDGSGHPGAVALAAQIRDHVANGEPPIIRYSVEGSTLEKKNNNLLRSVIRRIAATVKPCNKSAHAGILHDPHAPEGFKEKPDDVERSYIDDILDNAKKSERGDPLHHKLGGSVETLYVPFDELDKALDAGGQMGAPSTLTQGSALAPEHFSLRHKAKKDLAKRAMAAARDWNGLDDLDKFLKMRLPEASNEFVDKFKDMVQDYKMKKAEAQKQPKLEQQRGDNAHAVEPAADIKVSADHGPLTIRGKPVAENPQLTDSHFDERQGILHTPRGSFPMYIPSRDPDKGAAQSFHNIMNDPKVNAFHNYATSNWAKLNTLFKAGKLPPEVIMHAVLFSQLSPNTHVPDQELMYGHLADHMKQTGIDARSPEFGATKQGWMDRDNPKEWPVQSRGHFERFANQLRNMKDSGEKTKNKRLAGEIHAFSMPHNKWENMANYHKLHGHLEDLLQRHAGNGQAVVEELMHHKNAAELHNARRARGIKAGKADIGEYDAGPAVQGLAPKTARYTLGMLGAGDVTVPDTHFARYLFGLHKGPDSNSINYLKNVLWNPNGAETLNAIDRYYNQNHDAVQHMMEHPHFGHLFQEDRMNANFPAFWKNWVGIAPHEAARGMGGRAGEAQNEQTDHRPFWEATNPYVEQALKSEGDEQDVLHNLAYQTAMQHAAWVEKFGEMPAMMLYYTHLVPKLLAAYQDGAEPKEILPEHPEIEPDTYADKHFEPDLEPSEGVSRPFGNQPHVLPIHAFLPTMVKDALSPDSYSKHPAVNGGHYAIVTGENPRFDTKVHGENASLEKELTKRGLKFEKVRGKYGTHENAFLIHNPKLKHMIDIGRRYGQESILHAEGPHAHLIYTNGPYTGKMHIADTQHTYQHEPDDYYTTIPGGRTDGDDLHFTWSPDWSKFHDVRPLLAEHAAHKKFGKTELYEKRIRQLEYLNFELDSLLKAGEEHQSILPGIPKPPLPTKQSATKYLAPTAGNDADFVSFQGKKVRPGKAFVYPTGMENTMRMRPIPFRILGHTADGGIHGVEAAKFGQHGPEDIKHIARGKFELIHPAENDNEEPQIVNSSLHGDWRYNRTDPQHQLIHGTDMKAPKAAEGDDGINSQYSHWRQMGPEGKGPMSYVKRSGGGVGDPNFDEPHREVAYNNLARDVFGLGDYVPNAALFRHPKTNEPHAVIERVHGGEHPELLPKTRMGVGTGGIKMNSHAKALKEMGDSGELDKLAMMNQIMGNYDRHQMNYMMTPGDPKAKMKLIDHGYNFAEDHKLPGFAQGGNPNAMRPFTPHYIHAYNRIKDEGAGDAQHEPIHPAAQEWLHGIKPEKLEAHMNDMGIPKKYVDEAKYRLQNLQTHLGRYPYLSRKRALESHFGPPAESVDQSWYENAGTTGDAADSWVGGVASEDPYHDGMAQSTPESAEKKETSAHTPHHPVRRAGESVEAYNRRLQRGARNKSLKGARVTRQFRSAVTGEDIK